MYVSVLLTHSFSNLGCVWHFALDLLQTSVICLCKGGMVSLAQGVTLIVRY